MGYSEIACQFCGVSFNIGRYRTATEPRSRAWAGAWSSRDALSSIGTSWARIHYDSFDCRNDRDKVPPCLTATTGCYYIYRDEPGAKEDDLDEILDDLGLAEGELR